MNTALKDNGILVKTNNNKGILFFNPQISSNKTLKFEDNTCGTNSYFDIKEEKIFIEIKKENGKKVYGLNLEDSDVELLKAIHSEELKKAKKFYANLKNILIKDDMIFTKELIDTGYNEYYLKLFIHSIKNLIKVEVNSFADIEKILLKKINLNKYKEVEDENYGKFKVIPLKDIK